VLRISLSVDSVGKLSRHARQSSKVKGITDAQLGKVGVDFCCVNGFASERGAHVGRSDSLIVQVRVRVDLESMCVASYRLQEG
jgi:hypothetical protein